MYPVSAGLTSHSGNLTPEIWSGKTLIKFYLTTVFGAIANTDYEGEIRNYGDTVHIRTVPDITINDYVIGQDLSYERPTTTIIDLLIDKGKYYGMAINDVERLQADIPYVEKWTDDAGQQLGIKIDYSVLSTEYANASAYNKGNTAGYKSSAYDMGSAGTPLSTDKTTILESVVDAGSVLDEQDVPETQRWILFPPRFCGMIKKSDLKDASLAGDGTSIMRNGRLGMIDRFEIYRSNNLTVSSSKWNNMAGHPTAITFASQLTKNETIKNPNDFGDLMRGLQVFGHKTIKEEALIHMVMQAA